MNFTILKIFTIIFCSIFIVIGAGSTILAILSGGDFLSLTHGIAFIIIPTIILKMSLSSIKERKRQLLNFKKMTYEWYKNEHPEHIQNNKVYCFSCGGQKINARALMNHTYHREHFCTQCGKTLYYSPEQS
ncbi:hypothetical protein ACDW_20590 [Acidovorax sp. DW039]|uniref:hypothetical protein n=1 Tax=Acidovorax sp. DW039 TaxID=3095606 RepID=UPI00308828F5|nr:hypothetical protein ACDW_20590 [Acidovorax sp. DW039]